MKIDDKWRNILVLQHADDEPPGLFQTALQEMGVGCTVVRPDLGEKVPGDLGFYCGLLAMGGPQSVCDYDKFSFLAAEENLMRSAIQMKRPIFGVCLGSQLLAKALEARVYPAETFEIGWHPVTLSKEAACDSVMGGLGATITPLHGHGDVFELPPRAVSIGASKVTSIQGFISEGRFYGLLFHLEASFPQIVAMAKAFPRDLSRGRLTQGDLLSEAPSRIEALREGATRVIRGWANLLESHV